MPVPPPPPPPPPPSFGGPPPPPAYSQSRAAPVKPKSEGSGGRSALLSDIHKGARLKKVTQVNDRSAPQIENAEKSNNSGNGRAAMAPPAGGLFAGGFPALKPPGQRDAGGAKSAILLPGRKASLPTPQDQLSTNIKPAANAHKSPDLPRAPPSSAPSSIALRTPLSRPTVLGTTPPGPPPAPPSSSKPQLVLPSVSAAGAAPPPPPPPPPLPLYKEKTAKFSGISNPPPPPPAPPPSLPSKSQSNMFPKSPRPLSQSFPPPPPPPPSHPPPAPPSGYSSRTDQYPSSTAYDSEYMEVLPSNQASKDYNHPDSFPPPPPDMLDYPSFPPPPPPALSQPDRNRLSESLPPPPSLNSQQGVPPRPLKSPAGKNPPLPPIPGTVGRAHKGFPGGKAVPPPPPPTRSPFTELSSRQQPSPDTSNWTSSQLSHTPDDFESKFTFHSVDELPPPETYEPSERIYPSKCPDGYQPAPLPPPMRHQMR